MINIQDLQAALLDSLIPSRPQFKQAEQNLKLLEKQSGFAPALLELISNSQTDYGVRQAATVYFKNKLVRSWSPTSVEPLGLEDKLYIKQRIVDCIVKTPRKLSDFFLVCLSTIINYDYRNQEWPEITQQVTDLIQNFSDLEGVAAGLAILKEIVKFHRWAAIKINKQLEPLTKEVFPFILQIAESAVSELNGPTPQEIYYQLVYQVLKIYKFCTARFLPTIVREPEISTRIYTMLLKVFQLPTMETSCTDALKCLKWSIAIIKRTYSTQLNKSYIAMHDDGNEYASYRAALLNTYAPEITKVVVSGLLDWSQQKKYLSPPAMCHCIAFLTLILEHRQIYQSIIEPHLESLISEVIFRLLQPTENDIDLFEDDPAEYINSKLDMYDFGVSWSKTAMHFVQNLVKRRESTLAPMTQFFEQSAQIYQPQLLASQPLSTEVEAKNTAVLKLLQSIAPALLHQMAMQNAVPLEKMLVEHVLPILNLKDDFLRTEACDTISKCASMPFQDSNALEFVLKGIINCFTLSNCVPLQVSAAHTLRALTMEEHNLHLRTVLGDSIPQIISILLQITEKFDSEPLFAVINHFVDLYPMQVAPFAIDMAQNLSAHFVSVALELNEQFDIEMVNDPSVAAKLDDKMSAAIGILSSLGTLLISLDLKPEAMANVEQVLSPIFDLIYGKKMVDFYADCVDLHENIIRASNSVSAIQWRYFDAIIDMVANQEYERLEDVTMLLQSFIMFGGSDLQTNQQRLAKFIEVLVVLYRPSAEEIAEGAPKDDYAMSEAAEKADTRKHVLYMLTFLLSSQYVQQSTVAPYIPAIYEATLTRIKIDLDFDIVIPMRYNCVLVSTIAMCIALDPQITMQLLNSSKQSNIQFFDLWFESQPEFGTIFDHQVNIVAILSLLGKCASDPTVQTHGKHLVHMLADSLDKLPGAVERAKRLLNYENYDDDFLDNDEDTRYELDFDDQNGTQQTQSDPFVHEDPSQDFNSTESINDEEDGLELNDLGFLADDFSDSLLIVSPLELINILDVLRQTFTSLPAMDINPSDQEILSKFLQMPNVPGSEELVALAKNK